MIMSFLNPLEQTKKFFGKENKNKQNCEALSCSGLIIKDVMSPTQILGILTFPNLTDTLSKLSPWLYPILLSQTNILLCRHNFLLTN